MTLQSPCLGCTSRSVTCHGTCEKYTSFKQNVAKVNEERLKDRSHEEYLAERYHKAAHYRAVHYDKKNRKPY